MVRATNTSDAGHQESLLSEAAVAIARLDHVKSGVAGELANTFVAEARGTLQAIKRALEQEFFGSENAGRLETSRDLLQSILSDLSSGDRR
jgi:hypothetical protein